MAGNGRLKSRLVMSPDSPVSSSRHRNVTELLNRRQMSVSIREIEPYLVFIPCSVDLSMTSMSGPAVFSCRKGLLV